MTQNKNAIEVKKLRVTTFGLMGKAKAYPIYFKTRFGIHTFFLKFPIDVVILDKEKRSVKLVENLSPNHFLFWNLKYNHVVELPQGTIKRKKIKLGDKISLVTH
jgi:uncharacterized membrane protein (UPF0127 family)